MGMKCFSMSWGECASATALSDSTALSLTTVSSTVARLSSGGCVCVCVCVCVCPGVGVSGRGKSSISETDKGQAVVPWALSTH